jgi:Protein of unknown function (DUF4232)
MTQYPGGHGLDPEDLRRRLHDAVDPVRPSARSLARLQHRAAARRRQRRAMTAGGVAAVVAGFALATALYAPGAGQRPGEAGPAASGSDTRTETGDSATQAAGNKTWPEGERRPTSRPPDRSEVPPPRAPDSSKPTREPSVEPDRPSESSAPSSPATAAATCEAGDLRQTDRKTAVVKDGEPVGYGFLELVNVSGKACRVTGPPAAAVVDAADGSDAGFATAKRSEADSPGLARMPSGRTLLLRPQQAFRFQFAWTSKAAPESETPCAGPESADKSRTWTVRYRYGERASTVGEVALPAACRGTLYLTDLYRGGEYPDGFGH